MQLYAGQVYKRWRLQDRKVGWGPTDNHKLYYWKAACGIETAHLVAAARRGVPADVLWGVSACCSSRDRNRSRLCSAPYWPLSGTSWNKTSHVTTQRSDRWPHTCRGKLVLNACMWAMCTYIAFFSIYMHLTTRFKGIVWHFGNSFWSDDTLISCESRTSGKKASKKHFPKCWTISLK